MELLKHSDPGLAALYKKFHLDEPWDSPHNKELIKEIPFLFQDPFCEPAPGQTRYLGVNGEGCAFDNGKIVAKPKDGEPKRVAIVMAKDTVPWTKPCDLPVKDVESGAAVRWLDGFAKYLSWEGTEGGWPKSPPPDWLGSKPVFRRLENHAAGAN